VLLGAMAVVEPVQQDRLTLVVVVRQAMLVGLVL
jgi:hypothetical protein